MENVDYSIIIAIIKLTYVFVTKFCYSKVFHYLEMKSF